ncbi:MAG: 3-hydroxyacyl-CoA dehydrogenase family protein, partial [Rhodospirillaceae bacterium]
MRTPFAEGKKRERDTFLRLSTSDQAKALRHIFFAERDAGKMPDDAKPRAIEKVGIIGAGTMGTGIAMTFADAGVPATLIDVSDEALQRGIDRVRKAYESQLKRKRISEKDLAARVSLIETNTEYKALSDVDLIIEAAFESMDVKRAVFQELDAVAKPGAILATNTSYLDIDEIAATTSRPADVVGMHYFSPANIMKLLEVVRGKQTAPDVLATALKIAKKTGKISVIAGVCHGFIGNRMLRAYNREAGMLLLEGASPDQVDGALRAFGMAMGPFAVADLAGIDIGYKARKEMEPGTFEPMAFIVHDKLVEAGHLGQKSGAGFYRYDPETREKSEHAVVNELLETARADAAVKPRVVEDKEIVARTMLALISEGCWILDEGIAERASDIDVVYVHGYGFPRWRGGPMHYAMTIGWASVLEQIREFEKGPFGRWWKPAPCLEKLAQGADLPTSS